MAEQAQHLVRGIRQIGAGAKDRLHARRAQELVILRRDNTAGDDLDVGAAEVAEVADEFGDERLVARREARRADDVDVLGHRLLMASGAAFGGVTPDEVIDGLLAQVSVPRDRA